MDTYLGTLGPAHNETDTKTIATMFQKFCYNEQFPLLLFLVVVSGIQCKAVYIHLHEFTVSDFQNRQIIQHATIL